MLHRLIQALVAVYVATVAPATAGIISRQDDAASITIQNLGFFILSHAGKNDTDENGLGPYPPWTTYSNTVQLNGKWAECYYVHNYPQGYPGGADCAGGIPETPSLASEGCSPPNGDKENGLNGVSWSITRYGDRFVQQINVPDQDSMDRVYVACYVFNKSDFDCYPDYDEMFASAPDPPNSQDLTAAVGQVCPTF